MYHSVTEQEFSDDPTITEEVFTGVGDFLILTFLWLCELASWLWNRFSRGKLL